MEGERAQPTGQLGQASGPAGHAHSAWADGLGVSGLGLMVSLSPYRSDFQDMPKMQKKMVLEGPRTYTQKVLKKYSVGDPGRSQNGY